MLCGPDEHNEQPNFTYAYRIGDLALAVLDMRSERTQKRMMSLKTWNSLQKWMDEKLEGCRHLFVVSSIPVVYVNSNLVEAASGSCQGSRISRGRLQRAVTQPHAQGGKAAPHPPPPGLIVYAMEKVMADNVEEVDRGITARMMRFPSIAQHFIAKRNWLSLELDEVVRRGQKRALHQGRPPDRRDAHQQTPTVIVTGRRSPRPARRRWPRAPRLEDT